MYYHKFSCEFKDALAAFPIEKISDNEHLRLVLVGKSPIQSAYRVMKKKTEDFQNEPNSLRDLDYIRAILRDLAFIANESLKLSGYVADLQMSLCAKASAAKAAKLEALRKQNTSGRPLPIRSAGEVETRMVSSDEPVDYFPGVTVEGIEAYEEPLLRFLENKTGPANLELLQRLHAKLLEAGNKSAAAFSNIQDDFVSVTLQEIPTSLHLFQRLLQHGMIGLFDEDTIPLHAKALADMQ